MRDGVIKGYEGREEGYRDRGLVMVMERMVERYGELGLVVGEE